MRAPRAHPLFGGGFALLAVTEAYFSDDEKNLKGPWAQPIRPLCYGSRGRLIVMGLLLDNDLDTRRGDRQAKTQERQGLPALRRSGRILIGSLTLVCSLLGVSGASASDSTSNGSTPKYPPCQHEPKASDVEAAKGAFQAGKVSFEEGDYDRAILYWEDAFRRDCTAVKMLLNVARAYELRGDLEPAILALETYLERDPDTTEPVDKRIEKLKARAAELSAEQTPAAAAPAATPAQPSSEKSKAQAPPPRPIWPVVTTAAGIASIIVGTTVAALGQKAVGKEKDRIAEETVETDENGDPVINPDTGEPYRCTRQGRNWECPSEQLKDDVSEALDESDDLKRAETQRTVGILIASGGAIITGVSAYFWYALWNKSSSPALSLSQPALLPVLAPGYQGFSLVGRF
jgi:tetratricopeptide (TPR) repeat protein